MILHLAEYKNNTKKPSEIARLFATPSLTKMRRNELAIASKRHKIGSFIPFGCPLSEERGLDFTV